MTKLSFWIRLRHLLITSRWQRWLFPALCILPYCNFIWLAVTNLISQVLLAPLVMGGASSRDALPRKAIRTQPASGRIGLMAIRSVLQLPTRPWSLATCANSNERDLCCFWLAAPATFCQACGPTGWGGDQINDWVSEARHAVHS